MLTPVTVLASNFWLRQGSPAGRQVWPFLFNSNEMRTRSSRALARALAFGIVLPGRYPVGNLLRLPLCVAHVATSSRKA